MAWTIYNNAKEQVALAGLNWTTATTRVMLLTTAYAPDIWSA